MFSLCCMPRYQGGFLRLCQDLKQLRHSQMYPIAFFMSPRLLPVLTWLPINTMERGQVCASAKKPVKQPSQDPFCVHKELNKWHCSEFIGRDLQPGGRLQRGLGSTAATPLPSVVTVCSYLCANPSLPTPSWKHPCGSTAAAALSGWGISRAESTKTRTWGWWDVKCR